METQSNLEKIKKFHDDDARNYKKNRYHSESCEGLSYLTRKELVIDSIDMDSGKVLDIGCGPGIFTKDLLNKDLTVYSSDISDQMIKEARESIDGSFDREKAFFTVTNATNICYAGESMDLVLCVGVVTYLDDYNELIDEIKRILKLEGKLIIQIDYIKYPWIYRLLVPFYQFVKSKLTAKKYDNLNFRFSYFNYRDFLQTLESKGFRVLKLDHFDFRIPFLDVLFPQCSLAIGRYMFRNRNLPVFRNFSYGLLINAQKMA